jgi:hypothetical protein
MVRCTMTFCTRFAQVSAYQRPNNTDRDQTNNNETAG